MIEGVHPKDTRARAITTFEGKFIHVGDIVDALHNVQFMKFVAATFKVGLDQGMPPEGVLPITINAMILSLAGDPKYIALREQIFEQRKADQQ